jgi:signal transduction histidine kinase
MKPRLERKGHCEGRVSRTLPFWYDKDAMWEKRLSLGVAGPTILMSVVMLGLCTATAIFLYRQHAGLARILEEAVASRKVASDLEAPVKRMIVSLQRGDTQVESDEEEFGRQLLGARKLANTAVEDQLVGKLKASIDRFHALLASHAKGDTVKALVVLEMETLPACQELVTFNQSEIEKSETNLGENLKWMAWGLAAIGAIASFGGIFLGYGMARALRHSIHQLSVRIRDAADKLRQELPTVTLTSARDMDHLHEQIQSLIPQIEQVVERLQQREHEVLRAEQMSAVGQLAAGVAHELRNPLTAIKMLVQSGREDMEQRGFTAEDLQTIELEIRRLEKCLQTFLDFARPPRTECRSIDLTQVIERALALIGGRARKQHVDVRFTPPLTPVVIEADAEQLQQVLVNLGLNALDVMPRGGLLEVCLETTRHSVEVRMLDSGPGISLELLPRLFEPFVSSKETGLGLGLVVSRRIAEAHGGSLWGSNPPAGGACFTLRLPLPVGVVPSPPRRQEVPAV